MGSGGLLSLSLYSKIMNMPSPASKQPQKKRLQLPLASLILSLLLHLLVVVLILLIPASPQPPRKEQPTFVRLVERPDSKTKPDQEKTPDFEIDQQPLQPPPEEPVKSNRKATKDQRVDKEQAPRADDVRDQVTEPPQPTPPPTPAQPEVPTAAEQESPPALPPAPTAAPVPPPDQATESEAPPRPKPEVAEQQTEEVAPAGQEAQPQTQRTTQPTQTVPPSTSESTTAPAVSQPAKAPSPPAQSADAPTPPPPAPTPPPPQLSPQQLFPDANTLSRIANSSLGQRERRKEREDVEIGDAVWLNLQNDLLVSFFRRFQDRIEGVWNYPREAAEKGVEGTLQLLIIVDRDGKLLDVDLLHSSNSDILDYEAIQAIYRAAPFGPLTRHYPDATLKIRANFRYTLVGQYIFGQP